MFKNKAVLLIAIPIMAFLLVVGGIFAYAVLFVPGYSVSVMLTPTIFWGVVAAIVAFFAAIVPWTELYGPASHIPDN